MTAVTGFGGMFLRTDDPKALYAWYERHLGLSKVDGAGSAFEQVRRARRLRTQSARISRTFLQPVYGSSGL